MDLPFGGETLVAGNHKFDEKHAQFLHSKERERILPRERVFEFIESLMSLEGKVVADLGAGTGYFTLSLLEKVGKKGKVIAIDINQKMLDILKRRAKGMENLEIVLSKEDSIPVGTAGIDFAFCGDLLHELDGDATLRELHRILKPGALLVAVDWEKGKGGVGPSDKTRLAKKQAKALCENAGFKYIAQFNPGKHHYGVAFKS